MDKTMLTKQRFKSITIYLIFFSIFTLFQSTLSFEACKNNLCQHGACQPQTDNTYKCDCDSEYEGLYCNKLKSKNLCNPNPCKHNSECRLLDNGNKFTCNCKIGWQGTYCDTNVDDCASKPCLNNGVCIDQKNSRFYCKCQEGFTGLKCQFHDPCQPDPCKNGGVCNIKYKPGQESPEMKCQCKTGFYGTYCERDVNECRRSKNLCYHGGECKNVLGTYRCKCKQGYTGERCETQIDDCKSQPCQNNGTCVDKVGYYICYCSKDWDGDNCEIRKPFCITNPCGLHGKCKEKLGSGYECECFDDYEGPKCLVKKPFCRRKNSMCKNGGQCVNSGYMGEYECKCPKGFRGKYCEDSINNCKDVKCRNGGHCLDKLNGFKCQCQHGYQGRYCEHPINPCLLNPCQHGGTCSYWGLSTGQYKCKCIGKYGGKNCTEDYSICIKKPCHNNGTCTISNGIRMCKCRNGYVGLECERHGDNDPCAQMYSICNNGRVCEKDNSVPQGYRCVCPSGNICMRNSGTDISGCKSLQCINGGYCQVNANSVEECKCPRGFKGQQCEITINECLQNPCQHGGKCIEMKNRYFCECMNGYEGNNCEININDCQNSPCGIHGSCTDLVDGFRCKCFEGYTGTRCNEKLDPCKHHTCKNDALCIPTKSYLSYNCDCSRAFGRYYGINCQNDVDECNLNRNQLEAYGLLLKNQKSHQLSIKSNKILNPCVNNGLCINTEGSFVCRCQVGFEGNQCEINIDDCASKPCKNNGTCKDKIDNYECSCRPGFAGVNCEIDINECATNPCKNGAKCLDHVNMYQCVCPLGFSGRNCEVNDNDCTNSSCTGNGKCIDLVNDFRCECYEKFYGKYCEHRKYPCDRNPCQNNGTCINKNRSQYNSYGYECKCRKGYTGPQCELVMPWCNGNPCGENGTCHVTGDSFRCQCNKGYTGEKCELKIGETCQEYATRRFGDATKTDKICGSGECVDRPGDVGFKCSCKIGYRGSLCQQKIDFCAGHPCQNGGTCTSNDNGYICDCVQGFYGINCQTNRDDCASKPCIYGKCIDKVNGFKCICPPHISGKHCDIVEDLCTKVNCKNGASCISEIGGFKCNCKKGYTGRMCDIDINECRYSPAILKQALINNFNYNFSNSNARHAFITKLSSLGPCSPIGTRACTDQVGDYLCECKAGWTGKRCEKQFTSISTNVRRLCYYQKCSSNGKCVVKPDSQKGFECQCFNGFGGEECQYRQEKCSSKTCQNNGICRPRMNHQQGLEGYQCECPRGVGGLHCEVNLVNSCAAWKQFKRENYCYNGGYCSDASKNLECQCKPGFCGSRCEINDLHKCKQVAFSVEINLCAKNQCHLKRNNKRCDHECNLFACDFDGDECLYKVPHIVEKENVQLAKPWSSCSIIKTKNIPCQHMFMDGKCDPECNTENCLFDGWDCDTDNNNYNSNKTTVKSKTKVNGTMILILPVSTKEFINTYEHRLIEALSKLLHLFVRVERSKTGQKMIYSVRVFEDKTTRVKRSADGSQDEGKPGTKVYLELDNRGCNKKKSKCISNINSAVEFVSASLYTKHFDPPVSILSVQSKLRAPRGPDGGSKGSRWTNNILFVYVMMVMFIIIVTSTVVGVLYGFAQKKEKSHKASAEIWFPDGMKRTIRNSDRKLNINNVLNSRKRSANNSNPINNNLNDIGLNDSSVDDNNSGGSHSLTSTRLTNYEPVTSTNSGTVTQTTQLCTTTPNFDTSPPRQQSIMTSSYHHACTTPLLNNHNINFPISNSHHQFGSIATPNINRNTCGATGDLSMSASQASLLLNDAANNTTYINYPPEKRIKLNQMNEFSNSTRDIETRCFTAIANALVSGSGLGDLTVQEAHNNQMILEKILKTVANQPYIQYNQNPHNHHPHIYFINNHHLHPNNLALNYHSNYQMNDLHKMELPNNLLLSIVTRTTEDTGETLLHLAAKFNRHEATKILLEAGSDPNNIDNSNRNVFMVAVNAGAFEVARELLIQQKFPIDLQAKGPRGTTCLMEAIKHAHNEIIELILYNTQPEECDLNITDELGRTALHWASATDQPYTVQCLLRLGFNRDAQDSHDRTPLFLAALEGCYDVAHILLLHGANPDMGDHMDQLPVDIARKSDYTDIVQLLEQHAQLTKDSASLVHPHHPHHPIAVSSMLNHHSGAVGVNFGAPVFMNGAPANSSQLFSHQHSHQHTAFPPQLTNHRHQPVFPYPATTTTTNNNSSSWHSPNSTNSYFSNPTYATHTSPPQNNNAALPIFPPYTQDSAITKQQPPPVPSHNSQRGNAKTGIHYPPPSTKLNPLLSPSYTKHVPTVTKSGADSADKVIVSHNPQVNGLTPSTDSESPGHWSTSSPSLSPRSRNQLNTTLQQKNVLNNHNIPFSNYQQQQLHINSINPSSNTNQNNCAVETNNKNYTPPAAPQSSSSTSSVLHYHPSPTYDQQKYPLQNPAQQRNNIQLPQPQ